jgi:hypothetical protein
MSLKSSLSRIGLFVLVSRASACASSGGEDRGEGASGAADGHTARFVPNANFLGARRLQLLGCR